VSKLLKITARDNLEDGEFLVGYNSLFMVGDEELKGITKADIRFRPDEAVKAKLELFVDVDLDGVVIDQPKQKSNKLTMRVDVTHQVSDMVFDALYRERWENSVNRAYFELKELR
jgi:hypothetical protein